MQWTSFFNSEGLSECLRAARVMAVGPAASLVFVLRVGAFPPTALQDVETVVTIAH